MKRFSYACFPIKGATDSVALEHPDRTPCRLAALGTYRPLVIGRWQHHTIIFIGSVEPRGSWITPW